MDKITPVERQIMELIDTRQKIDRVIEGLKATLPNQGRRSRRTVKKYFTGPTGKRFEFNVEL